MSALSRIRDTGPGAVVAAAFVGPGTVTTSTLAGANFGYAIVWALVFATLATIILQEMAARLGTVAQKGLGEALRLAFAHSVWGPVLAFVVIVAIFFGNCAYEAGNISGAALGMQAVIGIPSGNFRLSVGAFSLLAASLLVVGSYRLIERVLVFLVLLMAGAFLATAVLIRPDLGALAKGALVPRFPDGSLLTIVALVGTTVIPYNLFLHASAAKRRWHGPADLGHARFDTAVNIGLGGLIAILIVATAAGTVFARGIEVSTATDMAVQLEPVFGSSSRYLLGFGLFAAGLSSAIAAPLAASYVVSEILGWDAKSDAGKTRLISVGVIAAGASFSLAGIKPIAVIVTAQFANGLLLPLIVIFLLVVMNDRGQLGDYTNSRGANVLGGVVLLVSIVLGVRSLSSAVGF